MQHFLCFITWRGCLVLTFPIKYRSACFPHILLIHLWYKSVLLSWEQVYHVSLMICASPCSFSYRLQCCCWSLTRSDVTHFTHSQTQRPGESVVTLPNCSALHVKTLPSRYAWSHRCHIMTPCTSDTGGSGAVKTRSLRSSVTHSVA